MTVYAYSAGTTIVYIGRTFRPRGRHRQHALATWWRPCFTFSIIGTYPEREARPIERALIKEHRPMFNVQSNPDYPHCRPPRPVEVAS